MSWFDTSGLANIAKSALKEAQKTIDKALDIKEDDLNQVPLNTPVDANSEDFFGGWGLVKNNLQMPNQKSEEIVTKHPIKTSTSLWGSFTGSFFDTTKDDMKNKDSVESLDDSVDLVMEQFSGSKLVVQPMEDGDVSLSRLNSIDKSDTGLLNENSLVFESKSRDKQSNRLSVVSCESKNSSESVEIVSNTTSPDSEALSLGQCISTSSSILGSKPNSDSVEVIVDSLTSPSSVEVLHSTHSNSRNDSQYTNEFVSPLQSPDENFLVPEKDTPDSVEVIPDDQEENSVAEDTISYTSISESTSATVLENVFNLHLKGPKNVKDTLCRGDTVSCNSISELSPDKNLIEPVTRAPSRGGMHLPIVSNLIDTQPQSTKLDILDLLKNTNVIDIPNENDILDASDEGFQSDKTIVPNDSAMESSSDTSTTTDSNTNSLYLKNMLADAMSENKIEKGNYDLSMAMVDSSQKNEIENVSITEFEIPARESSPISSGSRSDLVKIGSDQTSGHTSGDELETTTSSDIEIISSPNGDSSSTQSRHSPTKLMNKTKLETNANTLLSKVTLSKTKGHNRELSETSSISDDSELDKLVKRLSEMTDILESREAKLIEISRRNAELQEINNDYRQQLDVIFRNQIDPVDLHQVTEEYTQRLSALERKFQQAIREKDILRKQLDQCKQEAVTKMSKTEIDNIMAEKNETIKELREEGEKLSKQQLHHSTIIKKLRAKEKESESTIKHLQEKIEDLSSETDRLKRSVSAKEEVERSQIEAVHQLTERNKKLDNEVTQLKEQIDDVTQKYDTVKKSFEAAKKELIDKNKASNELHARQQMLQTMEKEKRDIELQNEDLINQLDDLRTKLCQTDQDMLKKEQNLRVENSELVRRLEEAESRNEELSQSILEVSKPLVQQLDSLQASHNKKVSSLEKIEQSLSSKLSELQNKVQTMKEAEKLTQDECITLRTKLSMVEGQLNASLHETELSKMLTEQKLTEHMLKEQELRREIDVMHDDLKAANLTNDNLKIDITTLQQKCDIEMQKNNQEHMETSATVMSLPNTRNSSPTLSLGKLSMSESMSSSFWPQDEVFDTNQSSRCTNLLEMQFLQTNLKSRDGELQQLQWELKRREHERTLLNNEITTLLNRVENFEEKLKNHEALSKQFEELQQQYDTLCQLYGEKVEETEELKLDLQDVKDMYKSQIDELLNQQKTKN